MNADFSTDYMIVGAGATGLSFADTLLAELPEVHITFVDRYAAPGGHWNDAYPFVALHQPSAFYGVNSLALGSGRRDTSGHNAGMYELASGAEVTAYFHEVMRNRLLPTGRVRYLAAHDFSGLENCIAQVRDLNSGTSSQISVRKKLVDATLFSPQVPATTAPAFTVADGVQLLTPTQLAALAHVAEQNFCVIGAGKTAMDTCIWLLSQGVSQEQIHWVMPRDSWLINRITTQPGEEFFEFSMGGVAQQMQALAEATSVQDLFERLEAKEQMFRIDRAHTPRMFHYATVSQGEVQELRKITQVIRHGRVLSLEAQALVFKEARVSMPPGTVYVNCTASAVFPRASVPMFQPGRITPQLVRAPLVTFSAAVCAYVEAHYEDDAAKNRLCTPVPFPHHLKGYIAATLVGMQNQMHWGAEKALRNWMRETRLDGFGKMTSSVKPNDVQKMQILGMLKEYSMKAAVNGQRLLAT